MKKTLTILITLLVTILFSFSLIGQEKTKTELMNVNYFDNTNDYHDLEKERLKLIAEMYSMMYEIGGLFTELERAQSLEKLLNKYKEKRTEVDSISPEEKRQIKRLEEIKSKIILPELRSVGGSDINDMKSISAAEGFRRIIENKVQEIVKKTDQLSMVGTKVTELNNTSYVSQNFKKQISWSFALLVGLVITGFFIIAYKDGEIRKTIFSGDVGLQFITIFSIIIAIILFGITEVLGGKEIAALIGGISGYILGRSSVNQVKKKKKKQKVIE